MKPDQNHKSHKGTSLNKELFKRSRTMNHDEMHEYATNRVRYERKLRHGTTNEMTEDEYSRRVNYLMCRKLTVELTQVLNHIIFSRLKGLYNST